MRPLATTGLVLAAWLVTAGDGGCGGQEFSLGDGGAGDAASSSSSGGSSGGSSSGSESSSSGAGDGGGCRLAADCRGFLPTTCVVCPDGSTGCAHWDCRAGACVTAYCAVRGGDGGPAQCGPNTCASGERCCDHCTGACISALSGATCPDDSNPNRSCADAGCATSGTSCLSSACCARLSCCSGVPIPPGQATCYPACPLSDRNMKAGFTPVATEAVLDAVTSLPLSKWHYKSEPPEIQHIGPMAQDFKAAFGVGADDTHIFQIDADGVSFAAIQALAHKVEAVMASQRSLERENADLRAQVRELEERATTLYSAFPCAACAAAQ